MSDKRKFPIQEARVVAEQIIARLIHSVERIEIAGSIRRNKSYVGDIELLFIPKIENMGLSLFEGIFDNSLPICLATQSIEALAKSGVIGKRKRDGTHIDAGWGPKNKLAFHCETGIPIDLFATTAENWWTSLVIRTGGKATNLLLTTGAIERGCHLNAYGSGITRQIGLRKEVIPATSEEHVFELCGVPYQQPNQRL